MPYVDHRWLGGMLTNFKTVKASIKRLKDLEAMAPGRHVREDDQARGADAAARDGQARRSSLGGIKDMNALPDALFVIDVGYHKIAVTEAKKLGIPIVGVVDTNHSPDGIAYVIPGNDDSSRAIRLYARGVADAILEGKSQVIQEIVQADEFVEGSGDEATDLTRSAKGAPRPFCLGITPARIGNLRVVDQKDVERTSMAEITASMVMELRERTGLGMMECKKALTEAGGDLAKAEELLRIKSGAKASQGGRSRRGGRRDRRVRRGRRQDRRDGRSQLRDRFRRAERRFRRVREGARAARRREESGRRRGAVARCRSAAARSKSARQALVQKIGENISMRRFVRLATPGQARAVRARRRASACWSTIEGGDEHARQGRRDAHRGVASRCACRRDQVPADVDRARSATIAAARAAESGKPAEHRRQDGRRRGRQVPGRGHAARPAVRQGHDKQTVEKHRQGARARRSTASRSTSSAKASRRRRTTSPPKSRRWPRPERNRLAERRACR